MSKWLRIRVALCLVQILFGLGQLITAVAWGGEAWGWRAGMGASILMTGGVLTYGIYEEGRKKARAESNGDQR
ncbi:hypothetical protein Kisp02_69170 [Kineosporia sp. NBRC 101731]|nr:hypothetical protein Kisp02_69170 [Kineosporia sp. NBRC 101731]